MGFSASTKKSDCRFVISAKFWLRTDILYFFRSHSFFSIILLNYGSHLQYDTAIFSILKFLIPDEWFQMQTDLRTVQKYRKRFVNLNPTFLRPAINQMLSILTFLNKLKSGEASHDGSLDNTNDSNCECTICENSDMSTGSIKACRNLFEKTRGFKDLVESTITEALLNTCRSDILKVYTNTQMYLCIKKYYRNLKPIQVIYNSVQKNRDAKKIEAWFNLWNSIAKMKLINDNNCIQLSANSVREWLLKIQRAVDLRFCNSHLSPEKVEKFYL